jgi:hypothetical protein
MANYCRAVIKSLRGTCTYHEIRSKEHETVRINNDLPYFCVREGFSIEYEF